MERHTFTVNFWASPSKARKTGLMPIYVTIRMNGERATFTTGKYIHLTIGMKSNKGQGVHPTPPRPSITIYSS